MLFAQGEHRNARSMHKLIDGEPYLPSFITDFKKGTFLLTTHLFIIFDNLPTAAEVCDVWEGLLLKLEWEGILPFHLFEMILILM